jgi:hypothetical protein
MALTKTHILYALIAVTVGFVFAFGYSGLTYHPLPLQVTEDIYRPAPVPTAAIPTLSPQLIKGSTAAKPSDPNDPYAPAPAPVVVTTQPLPDITPVTTLNPCCVNSNFNNTFQTTQTQLEQTSGNSLAFLGLSLVVIAIIAVIIVIGVFDRLVGNITDDINDKEGGFTQVIISAAMAFMVVAVMIVVTIPVINSILASAPSLACIC